MTGPIVVPERLALGPLEAPRSFETFYEAESRVLFRRMWLVTGNPAEAEELMQEAFVRVWERWDRVGAMDDAVGYLYRTAMNLFRKRHRRALLQFVTDQPAGLLDKREVRGHVCGCDRVALGAQRVVQEDDVGRGGGLGAEAQRVAVNRFRARRDALAVRQAYLDQLLDVRGIVHAQGHLAARHVGLAQLRVDAVGVEVVRLLLPELRDGVMLRDGQDVRLLVVRDFG